MNFESKEFDRFARQIILPEIGSQRQNNLRRSRVSVIGAGGLGTPTSIYLAAAGVGRINILDFDTIEETNLNRQFLYSKKDIGKSKAQVLSKKISKLYDDVDCRANKTKILKKSIPSCLKKSDCIILCVDNIETRLLINNYALKHNIPLIDGGVDGFYGYLLFMDSKNKDSACLSCLNLNSIKDASAEKKIPALGATCGVIASLQTSLCLNVLLDMPNPYKDCLLQYDGKLGEFEKIPLMRNPLCCHHN